MSYCTSFAGIYRKGNGLIFPYPVTEIGFLRRIHCGNANLLGDVDGDPGKSFLFFVTNGPPGIDSIGDRGVVSVKHRVSRGVRCVVVDP